MDLKSATQEFKYIFFGVIHPERACVSVSRVEMTLRYSEGQFDGCLILDVSLSQITATFLSPRTIDDIATLRNEIEDAVRIVVDAVGYAYGCGYDVEIIQMVDPQGNPPVVFGVSVPALEQLRRFSAIGVSNVVHLYADGQKGKYLQRCLASFREAIRSPKDTGFFCFRAIESLRHFFSDIKEAKDEKESWDFMRTTLDVQRSDIDYIQKFSNNPRHGGGGGQSQSRTPSGLRCSKRPLA